MHPPLSSTLATSSSLLNDAINSKVDNGEWLEVSVCGAVFCLNESRLTPCITNKTNKTNVLRDGTLIDLCGATLMWRSAESLRHTADKNYLDKNLKHLNRIRPQCPVGLKTLVFPSSASPLPLLQQLQKESSSLLTSSSANPASSKDELANKHRHQHHHTSRHLPELKWKQIIFYPE